MRARDRLFRFTALVAAGSLMLTPVVPRPVLAQPAPPQGSADQQTGGDPPARVGRLARITGTVSFRTAEDTQWNPVTLNYPVTSGNSFWTEPNAEADIDIAASRIVLAGGTELDIATLDTASLQATVPQGEIYLRIRALAPNEIYTVQTPRGQVTIGAPGRYEIAAGDTSSPTQITVIEGAAQVTGPNLSLDVAANQTATITGSDAFAGGVEPVQRDVFLTAMLNREQPVPAQVQRVAPPPVVAQMTGGEDLDRYGTWSQAPEYGQVWYPQVASGWVPYREGHWAYVAPWGWTWVDSAPWGFAPFHYGRWVDVGGRWGWTPGVATGAYTPVYAPALVSFFGVGVGVGVGAAIASRSVGWFPLGWREPYRPWYRTSPTYMRNVNPSVTNITTINQNVTVNNFANRGGATVAPASALAASQPIQRFGQRATPQQLAQARPVIGQEPVLPSAATAGVTPAVAQRMRLPPAGAGMATSARVVAPGPAIAALPIAANAGGRPPLHNPATASAAAAVRPPVAGPTGVVAPGGPAAQGPNGLPGGAQPLPPLAAPGFRPGSGTPGGAPGPAFTPRGGMATTGGPGAPATTVPGGPAPGAVAPQVAVPGVRPGLAPGAVTPGGAPGPAVAPRGGMATTGGAGPPAADPVTGGPATGAVAPQVAVPSVRPGFAPGSATPGGAPGPAFTPRGGVATTGGPRAPATAVPVPGGPAGGVGAPQHFGPGARPGFAAPGGPPGPGFAPHAGAAVTGGPATTAPAMGGPPAGAIAPQLAVPGSRPGFGAPGGQVGPGITPHAGPAVTGGPGAPALLPRGPAAPAPGSGPPPMQGQPGLQAAPGGIARPMPPAGPPAAMPHMPPPVAVAPQMQRPGVAPTPHFEAPPPQVRVAPAAPVVHAAPPPPPVVRAAPPPPPVVHAAPPQPPSAAAIHVAAPPPQVHAAPPPAAHAAPAAAPAQQRQKRPGEQ